MWPEEKNLSHLLTIREVSQLIKCNPATLRSWDKEGILPAIRIGKRRIRRYRREDIETFLAQKQHIKETKPSLKYQIIFPQIPDASPNPILITDTFARIYYVNPAWEKMTGYTLEEVRGENPRFLQSGKTPAKVYRELWRNLSQGRSFSTRDVVNKRKNGDEFHAHATYFPIKKNGQTVFYVQMFHDITHQLELEKQKDSFIGIASHELKTPITTLLAYSQVLEKRLTQTGDKKDLELLSNITRETKRLTSLIDDLLNVSRIDSGKMSFTPEVIDLNPLVEQVVKDAQHLTEQHRIIQKAQKPVTVIGDKSRLEQVLMNLLTNAIKYSPNADKIIVKLSSNKTEAVVSVEDFGFGISKGDLSHIFKRFYRTPDKENGKVRGFGLGLYISSEIMKKLKGKIWVQSQPGKGSIFYISLPLFKE